MTKKIRYIKNKVHIILVRGTAIKINNFNDNRINNRSPVKKSKTCNEENINRLNLGYCYNDKVQNHLGNVLETINEISNFKVDSSEISDKEDDNNDDNNNKNDNNNNATNNENNRKKKLILTIKKGFWI